ncbi:MAG: B12-binding domain-containing radical SAM protein [Pirellula sp.]
MPHVAFVPFTGLRVGTAEMLEFGMSLPGLRERGEALQELPALGLLTLAGMLGQEWSCSYHSSAAADSLVDEVLASKPDLVAVSALTASVEEAYRLCDQLRAAGVATVLGGLHATVLPEEASRHADAVCVGDGESVWLEILADSLSKKLKPQYQVTRPFDLGASPVPRFDLLPPRSIPRWTIQTQRGCPWACEFCGASRLLGPARFKPADRIDRELTTLRTLDSTPWIELADDNTLAGREDWSDMLQVIERHSIRYFTESDWRIGENEAVVKALARSGCVQVLIGIESLAFQYSGMGKKDAIMQRIMRSVDTIQDHGIVVNGCFIVGADGETEHSLDHLSAFIIESKLAEVQITIQTPFPGTALFRRLQKQQRILDRSWAHYNLFDVVYQPDTLGVDALERGFRRVLSNVFSATENRKRKRRRMEVWKRHPILRGGVT